MALTRKFLKALDLEDNQIEGIIGEHLETVNGLKGERDDLQEQLEAAKKAPKPKAKPKGDDPDEPGDDPFEAQLAAEKKAFADYKAQVEAEKAEQQKRGLYRDLLERAGIDSKRIGSVLKVSDLTKVTVKDGAIENADDLVKGIQKDWADFIPKITTEGATVAKPPSTGTNAVTKEQFAKMSLRQRNELYNTDRASYDALAGQD